MCTSFANYYVAPLYGMNFAIFETPLRLRVIQGKDEINVFYLDVWIEDKFLETAAMNTKGLFGNVQQNISDNHISIDISENQISMEELYYSALANGERISDVKNIIGTKKVRFKDILPIEFKLHNLFADKYGNAIAIETCNGENDITDISGKHMVLTNFPIGEFKGKHYSEVTGSGDDRYKIAYNYIENKDSSFTIEDGFEILKRTHQNSSLCSMIFKPIELEIYLCFKMNFNKIWRVALLDKTIETFKGFSTYKKFDLDEIGLRSTEFEKVC